MKFYSTNNPSLRVPLKQAVLQGLPADNGLFMPEQIPPLPKSFFEELHALSFPEMAMKVTRNLLGEEIPEADLEKIIHNAVTFDAPLVSLNEKTSILELFHGPTLAFKDFGARFMAQLMAYLIRGENRTLTILVATSGDTGGAVASGFLQTPGIEVIILYPSGKVSELQEKQLTALGHNITALEIKGTFDDCQAMVKQAFLDTSLNEKYDLTSANSINIARLIPQSFYYFRAFQQWGKSKGPVSFVVPSGNFGNLTAGLFAKKMGLPIQNFIAGTNVNEIVPNYLENGVFEPKPSVQTISNAMDVGNPSNFARMQDIFDGSHVKMRSEIFGYKSTDDETRSAISLAYKQTGYVLDPHAAVGWVTLEKHRKKYPETNGIILGTAHPSKFSDVVAEEIGKPVVIPEKLARLKDAPKTSIILSNDYPSLKSYLLGRPMG